MTGPHDPHRQSVGQVIVRVVAAVIAAITGTVFLALAWMVTRSRFGPPGGDPHGYALIFGTLLAVVVGLITSVAVPFVLPRQKRLTAFIVSMVVYFAALAALVTMLFTAD